MLCVLLAVMLGGVLLGQLEISDCERDTQLASPVHLPGSDNPPDKLQHQADAVLKLEQESTSSWKVDKVFRKGAWRVLAFQAISQLPTRVLQGDLYEFGVYTGDGLAHMIEGATNLKTKDFVAWGFDSFNGLPDEKAGVDGVTNIWTKGAYSARAAFKTNDTRQVIDIVHNHIFKFGDDIVPRATRVELIPGYFSDSLSPGLVRSRMMRPAVYVDVDTDQYIGAKQGLVWMAANSLLVVGTVVGYDDWWIPQAKAKETGADIYLAGEPLAHKEVANEFKIEFVFFQIIRNSKLEDVGGRRLEDVDGNFVPLFHIRSIGTRTSYQ